METNKPTDPEIKITCADCEGEGVVDTSTDRDDCDGRGHYTTGGDVQCETCEGTGEVFATYDAKHGTLTFNGELFTEWGLDDEPSDVARLLGFCIDDANRAKLQAWFTANVAQCAEVAADYRVELCGQAADEAEYLLSKLHSLFAHLIDSKMPCRHMSVGVAAITMAIPDIRADGRNRTATEADRIYGALEQIAS